MAFGKARLVKQLWLLEKLVSLASGSNMSCTRWSFFLLSPPGDARARANGELDGAGRAHREPRPEAAESPAREWSASAAPLLLVAFGGCAVAEVGRGLARTGSGLTGVGRVRHRRQLRPSRPRWSYGLRRPFAELARMESSRPPLKKHP